MSGIGKIQKAVAYLKAPHFASRIVRDLGVGVGTVQKAVHAE